MSYVIDFGESLYNFPQTGIYGVEFNGRSNPGTKLYDSRYLKFSPSNTITAGRDDFIKMKKSPFHIRECVTKYNSSTGKQEVLAYEGDSNWNSAISDSNHNRMIEFPKFYYNRPSQFRWEVSTTQHPGFECSPMHYRNGKELDKVYISRYAINSNYNSQSGHDPLTSITMQTYRANLRSIGMFMYDYAAICSINMLMIIKYASLDAQSIIGFGYVGQYDWTSKIYTGNSDNVKGKDGYSGTTKNSNSSIIAFGIENYWGNVSIMLDGIVAIRDTVYINTDLENINNTPTVNNMGNFVATNTKLPNNAYAQIINSSICYDSDKKWMMYASQGGDLVIINDFASERTTQKNYLCNDCIFWTDKPNEVKKASIGSTMYWGYFAGMNTMSIEANTDAYHYQEGSFCMSY